ncbi:MAG: hypothetical protein COS14_07020 [Bacteroidetes bacterium CG02_land_8_20_14_3_00_31_25]|nr:MAG: hypothetical protein COS14_07020 [Bacteroidetes bacterium CG02_land_8_20_14_3_00_31_25]PIX35829.1 MAG: hypothetical protein COZ59_04340 [Bacteroidetes bacterium CG_4_8_14_3_um_filter_31_14]
MDAIRIEILNPKVKRILMDLANLNLISIKSDSDLKKEFKNLLKKLRSNYMNEPTLEDITKEVEAVRKSRYEK